jgi:iron complex outermembrane receptor protein
LEFDLTENLLARLSINYTEQPRHAVGTYKQKNFYFDANGVPAVQPPDLDAWGTGPGNNLTGYRDPYEDKRVGAFQDYGFTRMKSTSPTLLLQWTLGSITLSSLTNYTDFQNRYLEDTDGSPVDWSKANQDQSLTQWSQEFKAIGMFGPHTWTAGLYYLDIDTTVFADFFFPALAGSDFAFDVYQNMDQRTRSWAPYGQIEWTLTDTLRLTTGVRYTRDRKTFDSQVYYRELGNGYSGGTGSTVFPPPGLLVYDFREQTVGDLAEQEEGLVSGKVQLDYKPSPDLLLYAGISRGVKGAGFNANLGGGMTNEETPFGSETVLTYEVGAKSELLDNSLRLNGSVYYYDYDDYQGFAFNGVQGVVGNYKGTFYGADLEALAELPGDVRLSLGAAYAHTELQDVPSAYAYLGVRDMRSVMAPEWTFNGSLGKTMKVGPGSLSMAWNFDYLSDRYASVDNNPATYVGSSTVHNLRVAYELEESGLEFAAFANNVTDEERQVFVYDIVVSGGYTIESYDKPRWYGVSVRKRF